MNKVSLFEHSAGVVKPEWIDYNKHMTVPRYFDAILNSINLWFDQEADLGESYMAATGHSMFTVQSHWNYLRELLLGDPLTVTLQLLQADINKIRYICHLYHAEKDYLAATGEFLVVHVNMQTRKTASFSEDKLMQLKAMQTRHASAGVSSYANAIKHR